MGRRRWALAAVALVAAGWPSRSFVVSRQVSRAPARAPCTGKQVASSTFTAGLRRARGGRPGDMVARRLFDSGSFFGVGVPEALVIALLGWFLLGPEELYKISKQVGGWLGELRTYIGQAARQYESALDDKSTRQAIEGLRQTQQTVSELAGSWRSVTDSLRDPLAISSTLQSTFDKYSTKPQVPPAPKLDLDDEAKTSSTSTPATSSTEATVKPEKSETSEGRSSPGETEAELEEKRAQSRQAVSDMWYRQGDEDGDTDGDWQLPKAAESFLARLDNRLDEIEELAPELDAVKTAATRLEELRKGVLEDRAAIREIVLQSVEKEKANQEA